MKKAKKKTAGKTAKKTIPTTTTKTAKKKPAGKKRGKGSKKEVDLAKVRDDIKRIVKGKVRKMVTAVANAAETGQLPQMRYLFEMTGIYPAPGAGEATEAKPEEGNALAKILLQRLDLPEKPAFAEEEDDATPALEKREHAAESSEEEKFESGETRAEVKKESDEDTVTAEAVPVE